MYEKIVLITLKTRLEELIERFNTREQAKFYIEHAGGDFSAYLLEHDAYRKSLESVRRAIETGLKIQVMDRGLVPTYLFAKNDVIVTLKMVRTSTVIPPLVAPTRVRCMTPSGRIASGSPFSVENSNTSPQ